MATATAIFTQTTLFRDPHYCRWKACADRPGAEPDLVTVVDLNVRLSPRRLRETALHAARQQPLELAGACDVVGVDVGVEQQRRLEAHLGHHLRISLGRLVDGVDDDGLRWGPALRGG